MAKPLFNVLCRRFPRRTSQCMNYVLCVLFPWPSGMLTWPSHGIPRSAVHRPLSTAVQLMAVPADISSQKFLNVCAKHVKLSHDGEAVCLSTCPISEIIKWIPKELLLTACTNICLACLILICIKMTLVCCAGRSP